MAAYSLILIILHPKFLALPLPRILFTSLLIFPSYLTTVIMLGILNTGWDAGYCPPESQMSRDKCRALYIKDQKVIWGAMSLSVIAMQVSLLTKRWRWLNSSQNICRYRLRIRLPSACQPAQEGKGRVVLSPQRWHRGLIGSS